MVRVRRVVGDDPAALCFRVAVDDRKVGAEAPPIGDVVAEARRGHVTRVTVQRLHQEAFRQRPRRAFPEERHEIVRKAS